MFVIKTPAKINLFLEVTAKRKDGYHNLNTLFLKLSLFDKLYFTKRKSGIVIKCSHKQVPVNAENLVYKAAELLIKKTGVSCGATIRLEKDIPVGAGLGGGSSDAAAALLGLNRLWGLKLPLKTLLDMGRKLGADVPLFLIPETLVVGRGIGDRLKPVKLSKRIWIILIDPQVHISTAQIYQSLRVGLTKTRNDVKILTQALNNADFEMINKTLFNRLEQVTFKKYKVLSKVKKKMSALGARAVLMSGSGSTIFAVELSKEKALRIKNKLRGIYKTTLVHSF